MAPPRLPLMLLALLLVSACSAAEPPRRFPLREPFSSPTSTDTLVVGFVGTLSGPDAWRGEDAFEGADLGVHDLNRMRPPGMAPFELVQLDDGGDAGEATELVEQLAALGSTVGIVYAGPPQGLPPAEGALARAGIPAILCYGEVGPSPHVFQVAPPLQLQARPLVRYLTRDRGYRRVGAIVERSAPGEAALRALRAADPGVARGVAAVRYASRSSRLAPLLRRLRRRRAEAVVIQGGPAVVSAALAALRQVGASYRTTAAARLPAARRGGVRPWRPQPAGLDLAVSPHVRGAPLGMVAPESYARGAHYLPLRSLTAFRRAFRDWWGTVPTGWEQRAYDASRLLGWAALRAGPDDDLARVLEGLRRRRFAALPVTFGASDHDAVGAAAMGLWVVPRRAAAVAERGRRTLRSFPWVPLVRTFRQRFHALPFGVRTPARDPVH